MMDEAPSCAASPVQGVRPSAGSGQWGAKRQQVSGGHATVCTCEQEALLPQALAVAHAKAQGAGQGKGGWALGMSPRTFVHLCISH